MRHISIVFCLAFLFLVWTCDNNDDESVFPDNIVTTYCLDFININNPVLLRTNNDIENDYLLSEDYVDSLDKQNSLDSCRFIFPIYTYDDYAWTLDYVDIPRKYKIGHLDRIMEYHMRYFPYDCFLSYDYLDRVRETSLGTIYKFKIHPIGFLLIATPSYYLPSKSYYGYEPSLWHTTKLLPIYSKTGYKQLITLSKQSESNLIRNKKMDIDYTIF